MKKIYHLATCTTCQRILKDLGAEEKGFTLQDIKTEHITPEQLDALKALRSAVIGFRDDAYRRAPHLRVGNEAVNMLSVFLLNAERITEEAEGRNNG